MRAVLVVLVVCATLMSGCSFLIEEMIKVEKTDSEVYDEWSCKHGEESPPGTKRRFSCVNGKTQAENDEELRRYQAERKIYLDDGAQTNSRLK